MKREHITRLMCAGLGLFLAGCAGTAQMTYTKERQDRPPGFVKKMPEPEEDVRFFEIPVEEIEGVSVNHKQGSLDFVIHGTSYFYYVQAPTEAEKIMAVSDVYRDVQNAATIQIKHVRYGLHRRVVNLLVFQGERDIPESLNLAKQESMPFESPEGIELCNGPFQGKVMDDEDPLIVEIDKGPAAGKKMTVYFDVEPGMTGADYSLGIVQGQWKLRKADSPGSFKKEIDSGKITLPEDDQMKITLNKDLLNGTLNRCWTHAAAHQEAAPASDIAGETGEMMEKAPETAPCVPEKIIVSLDNIDEHGLTGPPDGKVSFEFCIPYDGQLLEEIQSIDEDIKCTQGSSGRTGCRDDEYLCVGHVAGFEDYNIPCTLSTISDIKRIDMTLWE